MAEWVYDNLGKEIVLAGSDYAGGHDVIAEFKGPYLKKGGKVLKEIFPPLGTNDFSAYLTDIKAINPPVTYDFMPGTDAMRFIQPIWRIRTDEDHAADRLHHHRFAELNRRSARPTVGVISAGTYIPTRSTILKARSSSPTIRRSSMRCRTCSPTTAYVGGRAVGEALKLTNGDTAKTSSPRRWSRSNSTRRAGRSASIR